VQNNSIFVNSIVNLKKINKILVTALFTLKMTVTATKIDSSHESGKNFVTWAWPTSTTIIYNNPVLIITSFIIEYLFIR
jgi:hypothetical protein